MTEKELNKYAKKSLKIKLNKIKKNGKLKLINYYKKLKGEKL